MDRAILYSYLRFNTTVGLNDINLQKMNLEEKPEDTYTNKDFIFKKNS